MPIETSIPLQRAERLYKIGQLFLDNDPVAKQTGVAERIDYLWIREDAKLPEFLHPENEWDIKAAESNAKACSSRCNAYIYRKLDNLFSTKKREW